MIRFQSGPAIVLSLMMLSLARPCLGATLIRYALDVESMTRFYAALPEVRLLTESAAGSRLRLGETYLWILPARPGTQSTTTDRTLVLIPVPNLTSAGEHLLSRGIVATRVVEQGIRFLRFTDPEGYAVGVLQSRSDPSVEPSTESSGEPSAEPSGEPSRPETSQPRGFRSGHTEMIITGGLYGIWLSTALPFALDANDPQVYGASILLGGSAATYLAHRYARGHSITSGQAGLITVMTHFATSQALGWSAISGARGRDVVLTGALASLGAISTSALIAKDIDISRGQAEILGSALAWGAWYGFSAGIVADADRLGPPTLVGSAAAFGLAGLWISHNDIGVGRTRLINLGGILGTVAGFGLNLMFEVEGEDEAFVFSTLGGLGGMVGASYLSRDRSPESSRLTGATETRSSFGQMALSPDGQIRLTLWGRTLR